MISLLKECVHAFRVQWKRDVITRAEKARVSRSSRYKGAVAVQTIVRGKLARVRARSGSMSTQR